MNGKKGSFIQKFVSLLRFCCTNKPMFHRLSFSHFLALNAGLSLTGVNGKVHPIIGCEGPEGDKIQL
jgi:hypothetical protein